MDPDLKWVMNELGLDLTHLTEAELMVVIRAAQKAMLSNGYDKDLDD